MLPICAVVATSNGPPDPTKSYKEDNQEIVALYPNIVVKSGTSHSILTHIQYIKHSFIRFHPSTHGEICKFRADSTFYFGKLAFFGKYDTCTHIF